MTKSAAQYVLSVNIEQKEKPMTQSTNQVCNDCNKTDGACCHDTIMTDNKAQRHIISAEDQRYHDDADNHVFLMNGLYVAKDVVRQKSNRVHD